ncbi:MAG: trypsin-like peptidase domain-containing protein [Firmicutes bacterium]|nr:trypsin-like peptidase domain-containing protein [Bacillota bacterium]
MEGSRIAKKILALLLVAVIALGCGFGGAVLAAKYYNQPGTAQAQAGNTASTAEQALSSGETKTADPVADNNTEALRDVVLVNADIGEAIAEKVMPSVVGIETKYETTSLGSYWYFGFGGGGGKTETTIQGTGFVVDESGYILTNSHVIHDGDYKTVTVLLYDSREFEGTVLWNDSTLDLAIVKIEADNLIAAELGDSDLLKVGSYAAALGNPLGLQFKFSMSQGIISGLERTIEVSSGSSSMSATTMEGLLQTDATINSGNSGGPLVNKYGQVVGINSAKASSGEGMGFAIPINSAKPIVRQIKQTGSFSRAYLGISGQGLEESTGYNAEAFKERYGTARGIYVYSVAANGGAEAAGLQKGDIVLSVDGTEVGTMNKINTVLVGYNPGDKVTVKYLRNGEEFTVTVTLTGSIG